MAPSVIRKRQIIKCNCQLCIMCWILFISFRNIYIASKMFESFRVWFRRNRPRLDYIYHRNPGDLLPRSFVGCIYTIAALFSGLSGSAVQAPISVCYGLTNNWRCLFDAPVLILLTVVYFGLMVYTLFLLKEVCHGATHAH